MIEGVSFLVIGAVLGAMAILWHYGKLAGILAHIKEIGHPAPEVKVTEPNVIVTVDTTNKTP